MRSGRPTVATLALAGLLSSLSACSHGAKDCRAFHRVEQSLTRERDGQPSGTVSFRQAALALAEYEVQDKTGCASAEDRARAQADIDSLRGG